MRNLARVMLLTAAVAVSLSFAAPQQAEAHRRWAYYGPRVVYAAPPVVYAAPYVAYRPRPILAPRRVRVAPVFVPAVPRRVYYYGF